MVTKKAGMHVINHSKFTDFTLPGKLFGSISSVIGNHYTLNAGLQFFLISILNFSFLPILDGSMVLIPQNKQGKQLI